jgi:hypothetical protein
MSETEVKTLVGIVSRLERLEAKIDNLTELYNKTSNGDGFPRCAKHATRLDHAEESLELCHARISGVKKWGFGARVIRFSVW